MVRYRLTAHAEKVYGATFRRDITVRCYDEAALDKAIERYRNEFAVDHWLSLSAVAVKAERLV